MDGAEEPLFQTPPEFPLRVTEAPLQKVVFPLAEMKDGFGNGFTVTVIRFEFTLPHALEFVTK